MSSSTSLMVPEEHLSRVAGINQAIRGSLNIVAPPLGALLMTLLAFYQVISIDIITAVIAITPLFFIMVPQPERSSEASKVNLKVVLKDMEEGFNFMKSWPGLLILAGVAAFINLVLVPTDSLMPLLVTQYFKKGVWELSLLDSMMGIGIVVGGVLLGIWGGFKNKVVTSMFGVMGIGLGIMLVGVVPAGLFPLAVAGTALFGFMMPMANGPMQALMQSKVPPEIQGRVMSFVSSICAAMMPVGLLISAPVVKATSLQTWFWVSGAVTILLGLSGFFIPQVLELDRAKMKVEVVEEEPVLAG
jgi:DHA3 family macrolide efflux protein-like MFS transporter